MVLVSISAVNTINLLE